MKIATYNIQRGRGLDFARRIERAVAVLRSIDADIVALQEVVVGPTGDQAKTIADALGMQHRFAAARPHGGSGEYGLALLSRAAIGTVRPHDLSVPRCEPRIVLQAETLGVRVFVCHFGLGPRERAHQAIRLRAILAEAPKPRVVLGDFNEWTHGAVAHALEAELGVIPRVKTHPAAFPLLALDRIYSDLPQSNFEAHRTPPAHVASDHLPLVSMLTI